MRKKYTISVIMGIYNCGSTLPEAIDSLYCQTFKDFELIMCDDGSTDDTYEIARKYSEKYSNIVLLKNEQNRGLNYTLNYCLSEAGGTYIARMDGDDLSLPCRFEKELNFLESNPEFAIVSTAMIYFDENGEFMRNKPIPAPTPTDFVKGTPHCHAPCMVRKQAYEDVNGYGEDKWMIRVEDYDLWFKMYAKGYRGFNIQEPLYMMRDDRNAIARRTFKKKLNVFFVMNKGFRMLGLPYFYHIFTLRPLLVGLLPKAVYTYYHRRKFKA